MAGAEKAVDVKEDTCHFLSPNQPTKRFFTQPELRERRPNSVPTSSFRKATGWIFFGRAIFTVLWSVVRNCPNMVKT